jgi:hypothetical protein
VGQESFIQSILGGWNLITRHPIAAIGYSVGLLSLELIAGWMTTILWYSQPTSRFSLGLLLLFLGKQIAQLPFRVGLLASSYQTLTGRRPDFSIQLRLVTVLILITFMQVMPAALLVTLALFIGAVAFPSGWVTTGTLITALVLVSVSLVGLTIRAVFAMAPAAVLFGQHRTLSALRASFPSSTSQITTRLLVILVCDFGSTLGGLFLVVGSLPFLPLVDLAFLHRWNMIHANERE